MRDGRASLPGLLTILMFPLFCFSLLTFHFLFLYQYLST
jgi:hypothetical protein